jgi:hypothetical protein
MESLSGSTEGDSTEVAEAFPEFDSPGICRDCGARAWVRWHDHAWPAAALCLDCTEKLAPGIRELAEESKFVPQLMGCCERCGDPGPLIESVQWEEPLWRLGTAHGPRVGDVCAPCDAELMGSPIAGAQPFYHRQLSNEVRLRNAGLPLDPLSPWLQGAETLEPAARPSLKERQPGCHHHQGDHCDFLFELGKRLHATSGNRSDRRTAPGAKSIKGFGHESTLRRKCRAHGLPDWRIFAARWKQYGCAEICAVQCALCAVKV